MKGACLIHHVTEIVDAPKLVMPNIVSNVEGNNKWLVHVTLNRIIVSVRTVLIGGVAITEVCGLCSC